MNSEEVLVELIKALDLYESRPEAIVPAGRTAFARNTAGAIVGLKCIFRHGTTKAKAKKLLSLILELEDLERLVVAHHAGSSIELPASISKLRNLKFFWLSGNVRSLPPTLLDLNLPIYTSDVESKDGEGYRELNALTNMAREAPRPQSPRRDEALSIDRLEEESRHDFSAREEINLLDYAGDLEWKARSMSLRGIFLSVAKLEDPPPEIIAKGSRALRAYFADRADQDHPLNEVKVILVGDGGSGKTSLVKRLVKEKFRADEPQTHGINIRQWDVGGSGDQTIKIHLWDFGGQEIMHATHQFFLSKRSLYVIVLDGRKEEDAEYWLQHVESFGGESPVIVVINKIDENPSYDVNRKFLRLKYPEIVDFFKVSCKSRSGLASFKKSLERSVQRTPILSTRWPASWFKVKEKLELIAASTSYISLEKYSDVCKQEGVTGDDAQATLVDFLHDLGVIVHFRDLQLLDTHVLNPRWVTQGVYRIINSEQLAKKRGLLRLSDLKGILTCTASDEFQYPPEKHNYLVELMLKFELCYRLDEQSILVPDLLDVQEPETQLDDRDALRFILQYEYLPKSVIPRFIVRLNRDIKGTLRWRTGVVLMNNSFNATALVRADETAKRIFIFVSGSEKRGYFSIIRDAFHDINRSFEKLGVKELVPLPDHPDVTIEYQELVGYETSGRDEYFVGRLQKTYNVRLLLDGLVEVTKRVQERSQMVVHVEGDYFGDNTVVVKTAEEAPMESRPQTWEKAVVYAAAVGFVGLLGFLLVRNEPIADRNLVVALRILLSLCVAALGAAVPGMLNVGVTAKGLAIRATGALALFVIAFLLTPTVL